MDVAFRDSASFGKRQEYVAIAELLKRGFDVYMTLVDDQQIDCVIRLTEKPPRYLDVQIKARSKDGNKRNSGMFSALVIKNPRPNFFYIFYSEHAEQYWVMPSRDLVRHARRNKTGKNAGKFSITFTHYSKTQDRAMPRPKFKAYMNDFERLRQPLA